MGQHAKMMSERVVYDLEWPFQTAAIRSMNWNAKTYLDNNHQRLFCKKRNQRCEEILKADSTYLAEKIL